MPGRSASEPRKRPRQRRARATVQALLDAAAHILASDGIEQFSTNRVAAVAGASIGSLYQYFPNKQALVRALLERQVAQAEASRPEALQEDSPATLAEGVRAAVRWHLANYTQSPELHAALTALAGEVLTLAEREAFERYHEQAVRRFLERHRRRGAARLRVDDVPMAAFLVSQCLQAAVRSAAVLHPDAIADGRLERELGALILRYLLSE